MSHLTSPNHLNSNITDQLNTAKFRAQNLTLRTTDDDVIDYRHEEKRKNIPEDGLITYVKENRKTNHYQYDAHLDPQLQWAGKAEHSEFEVDTVSLHIHERISTKAILESVKRKQQTVQTVLNLFAEPELPLDKRIEFYQHDVDWSNRLILGDSLLVMNSLIERELMAGRVHMIYMDPPYGVSFSSNFQPSLGKRDVKDDDESLTREPEQIKAYRDTWELGIHSYLTYLRDRLLICRELLHESGSVFVQINDQNLHHVREVMDEIFGADNFCAVIPFSKTVGQSTILLPSVMDFILWYARDRSKVKYRKLYTPKELGGEGATGYTLIESPDGKDFRSLTKEEILNPTTIQKGWKIFDATPLVSQGYVERLSFPFKFKGQAFKPPANRHWTTTYDGMDTLVKHNRLVIAGRTLQYKRYLEDFPVFEIGNVWMGMGERGFVGEKLYAVQTAARVIARCLLMTTDPGDLVVDPTCGSGTTAYVAEQFGRRWITCDTSRVALTIARQRLLTATFPYYKLEHPDEGVRSGFDYEKVPHITLKSIAQSEPPRNETLYDKPKIDSDKVRVSGPFTVEAIPVPAVEDPFIRPMPSTEQSVGRPEDPAGDHVADMIGLLSKTQNINFSGGKKLELRNIRPVTKGFVHAEAESSNGEAKRVAISFGPRHGPVGVRQLQEAMRSAQWEYKLLILAGFTFDPEVQAFVQKNPHPHLAIQLANINPDVLVEDLLKTKKGSQIFTVFGQPDINVEKTKDGEYVVEWSGHL